MATPHNNASLEDVSKVVLVTVDRVSIKQMWYAMLFSRLSSHKNAIRFNVGLYVVKIKIYVVELKSKLKV